MSEFLLQDKITGKKIVDDISKIHKFIEKRVPNNSFDTPTPLELKQGNRTSGE